MKRGTVVVVLVAVAASALLVGRAASWTEGRNACTRWAAEVGVEARDRSVRDDTEVEAWLQRIGRADRFLARDGSQVVRPTKCRIPTEH